MNIHFTEGVTLEMTAHALLELGSAAPTIQNWLQKFTLGEGFLDDCIAAMKVFYGLKLKDRQIVIAFDEMALRERWPYDQVR